MRRSQSRVALVAAVATLAALGGGVAAPESAATEPQQTPPGFVLWSAAELAERNRALSTRISPDGSGRETLADYVTPSGSHRFRHIRREEDRRPEEHDEIDDVVFVTSGEATVLVGGEMLGRTGDLGTEIRGGTRYAVTAGDVLRIPARTPHEYSAATGGHVTYVLVRLPRFLGSVVERPDGDAPRLDPAGFALWRGRDLEVRDAVLGTRIGVDGSARETLADYGPGGGSHRFRFIRRESDGRPELHEDIIDVVHVHSGAGTVLVGGEMIGASNAPGTVIRGGTRHAVGAGDLIHIPAGVPHAYLVPAGGHITYVLVRVPAVGG